MAIDERISGYSDKELGSLHDNVRRLAQTGSTAQRAEAERLMPGRVIRPYVGNRLTFAA